MRSGEAAGLKRLEAKALSVGSEPDGGYLVPDETEREIARRLAAISPIRAIASVRTISGGVYKKPFSTAGAGDRLGRRDRGAAADQRRRRSPSSRFPAMELYAMPAATQRCSTTPSVDIDAVDRRARSSTAFAEQEGAAFVTGDGTNKPKGFLAYTTVAEARLGLGQASATSRPARPAPSRRASPPTC